MPIFRVGRQAIYWETCIVHAESETDAREKAYNNDDDSIVDVIDIVFSEVYDSFPEDWTCDYVGEDL